MVDFRLSFVVSKVFQLVTDKNVARPVIKVRTKTFLEEQALKKNILSISWFVANTYFLVSRAEAGLYQVQCQHSMAISNVIRPGLIRKEGSPHSRILPCFFIEGKGDTFLLKPHG
jgi:hypothetical protein